MTLNPGDHGTPLVPGHLRPRPLEIASGLVIGTDLAAPALPRGGTGNPRACMEETVRRALQRPPCLVSFSGGRDSSAVLATAASVARREGLALPVPVTYRFAAVPTSDEAEWQEQVVAHLRLQDWERLAITDELDSVGPVAQAMLGRHGPLWPFNAHFHIPVLERARGGTLLTGIGGDELFGRQLWSAARSTLFARRFPRRSDLRSVALALTPRPVRRRGLARHRFHDWPWLRPQPRAEMHRQMEQWLTGTPLRWDRATQHWWQSRYHTVLSATMDVLAADAGANIAHPFMDDAMVAAAARRFGARGPVDRSAAMNALFGDILAAPVISRSTKATFDRAFFSDHSRAFVASWDGSGADDLLVDTERLAQEWRSQEPDPRSFLLIQAAWVACR